MNQLSTDPTSAQPPSSPDLNAGPNAPDPMEQGIMGLLAVPGLADQLKSDFKSTLEMLGMKLKAAMGDQSGPDENDPSSLY